MRHCLIHDRFRLKGTSCERILLFQPTPWIDTFGAAYWRPTPICRVSISSGYLIIKRPAWSSPVNQSTVYSNHLLISFRSYLSLIRWLAITKERAGCCSSTSESYTWMIYLFVSDYSISTHVLLNKQASNTGLTNNPWLGDKYEIWCCVICNHNHFLAQRSRADLAKRLIVVIGILISFMGKYNLPNSSINCNLLFI